MRMKMFLMVFVIVCSLILTHKVYSAPDPVEVEKIKTSAPVHLIGVVRKEELYKDLTQEMGTNYQIRKIEIEVNRYIKNFYNLPNVINVFYPYIPSWQVNEWEGGKRVDLAVKDQIEIWLTLGEYGLEPALGGNTINHLKYAQVRPEPIKEPVLHLIVRKSRSLWVKNSSFVIVGILVLVLLSILFKAYKK